MKDGKPRVTRNAYVVCLCVLLVIIIGLAVSIYILHNRRTEDINLVEENEESSNEAEYSPYAFPSGEKVDSITTPGIIYNDK